MTSPRATRRWRGVVALSLFAGSVGLLAQRPSLLVLATLGVGYAAYPRLVPPPPEPELAIERTVARADGESRTERIALADGDVFEVSVTVRNEGERWLPDLRIVDGVPTLLPVVDGPARRATTLGPGEEATFRYEVAAREGKHRFGPTTVLSRDASGAVERRTTVHEPTVVDCGAPVSSAALRDLTSRRTGELLTDEGGSGIEFHRTREYRQGDPMKQVDWRRFARTGELGTVEFREERAAAVVLCVDVGTRPAGSSGGPTAHAVARCVGAADRLAAALIDANHEVGLAAFGPEPCWRPPGVGTAHLAHLRRSLDGHEAFAPGAGVEPSENRPGTDRHEPVDVADAPGDAGTDGTAPQAVVSPEADSAGAGTRGTALSDGGRTTDAASRRERRTVELRERLGPSAQVTLLTPLADDEVVSAARVLEAAGHPVTVVSPDATTAETIGGRLATRERATRIRTLQRLGVPVVDWGPDDHLGTELAATLEAFE